MRVLMLMAAAAAVLAGCARESETPNADSARRICVENGNTLGSDAFNRCFETTYAAILGRNAAMLSSSGGGTTYVAPVGGYAPPARTAPVYVPPAAMPCPRPWGMGQAGQAGQRGQGANCS